MSLDGTNKLPTLRPSRDLKLTGGTKPNKPPLFTPNLPSRKRPAPSHSSNEDTSKESKRVNSQETKFKPFSSKHFTQPQIPDGKRGMETNRRKNNFIVTTSIFSCGLAEKAIKKTELEVKKKADILMEDKIKPSNTEEHTPHPSDPTPEECLDQYDDSVPRMLPLDQSMSTKGWSKLTESKLLSQWNKQPRMLPPCWPGLGPTPAPPGEEVDKALASDLFNTTDDKAQIIFLQIPDKFPIQRARRAEETEIQYLTAQKHGRSELASLKQLPQGTVGSLQVHASGRVSIKIGDATFNLTNATPSQFLQELVVIDHPPGSAEGHLTHLGYLSGRMVCAPDLEALASQPQPT